MASKRSRTRTDSFSALGIPSDEELEAYAAELEAQGIVFDESDPDTRERRQSRARRARDRRRARERSREFGRWDRNDDDRYGPDGVH